VQKHTGITIGCTVLHLPPKPLKELVSVCIVNKQLQYSRC